jgi:hypothetical protein
MGISPLLLRSSLVVEGILETEPMLFALGA